jgi:hypothetical protein
MNDVVLQAIRERALDPRTRTDFTEFGAPSLATPASGDSIRTAEQALGFSLWPDHRQLLREVANGGFGPGYGLVGTADGTLDDDGRSLIDLQRRMCPGDMRLVPLCDWGCGIWSFLDSRTGSLLTSDDHARLFDLGLGFAEWMTAWSRGTRHWDAMFEREEVETIDRRTGQKVLLNRARTSEPKGTLYRP